jgi:hypothetical protein
MNRVFKTAVLERVQPSCFLLRAEHSIVLRTLSSEIIRTGDLFLKKSRFSNALLALMPVLAIAAIYWKIQRDKFPYVGTWVGSWRMDGATVTRRLSFHADGSCSSVGDVLGLVTRYSCSYKMQGKSALITVELHEVQVINGALRLPKTPIEKAQATIFTAAHVYRVTPLRGGESLLVTTSESRLIHQETGQSKRYPYRFKEYFQKQK